MKYVDGKIHFESIEDTLEWIDENVATTHYFWKLVNYYEVKFQLDEFRTVEAALFNETDITRISDYLAEYAGETMNEMINESVDHYRDKIVEHSEHFSTHSIFWFKDADREPVVVFVDDNDEAVGKMTLSEFDKISAGSKK